MKLKSILKQLSCEDLRSIVDYWRIHPPALEDCREDETRKSRMVDYLYPRLQLPQYFDHAYKSLRADEKDLVYFLAIHGGDVERTELIDRFFKGNEKKFEEQTARLKRKGFVFFDDLNDEEAGVVLVGVPEPFLRYVDLPPYWEGYLGNFLKDLSTQQLKHMAHHGLKLQMDTSKKNYLLTCIRRYLLEPGNLRFYIEHLPDNERQVFRSLLDKKGVSIYRDLLDLGYQKRYDHSKADFINNLLATSGLVFTAVGGPNKYNHLLMVPRDILYIINRGYEADNRSLRELDTVSIIGKEKQPAVMLDNTTGLLRDIVIFASYINRNPVKQLSNGGIGKNDLKKIMPSLSPNKTLKYVEFIALFCISKKFILGVGETWKVTNSFLKWLEDSRSCYHDLYTFWLESTEWNEEYLDGNTVHADVYPSNLINVTELRKLVLRNIENIPYNKWIDFGPFVESLLPQIDINIPKRGTLTGADRYNRPNQHIVESIIAEPMYWIGLVSLGLDDLRTLEVIGNREGPGGGGGEASRARKKGSSRGRRGERFLFRMTDLGRFVLENDYLQPEKLFSKKDDALLALDFSVPDFTVQPNLEVITPPDLNLRVFYNLNEFCDIKTIDVMSTLVISKESLREGMDKGLRGSDILNFLNESCRQEVPETVKHLIQECGTKHGEVNLGYAGGYILVGDRILLEEIKSHRRMQNYIKDIIDNKLVLLNPDVDVKKLAKEMQRLGFMPHLDSEHVHLTSEGKYHLTLSQNELFDLVALLRFLVAIEEDLGPLTEDKVRPLLERLKPDSRKVYNLTQFAESMLKSFQKRYDSATKKKFNEATSKYRKQLTRLIAASPRGTSKYDFGGPNPAAKKDDVREMLVFAIDNELPVELDYAKLNRDEINEEIEPESLEGDKLYAYCAERGAHSIYHVDRIKTAKLL
ncbi:MAG: helicase-associated domain-containing protein [bacterium]